MDSGFYWPIIKLASAHLLDCELGERSSRLQCCRELQDTVYCFLKFCQYLFRCTSVDRKEESAFLLSQVRGGSLNQIRQAACACSLDKLVRGIDTERGFDNDHLC